MKRLNSNRKLRARIRSESGVALFLTLILVSTLSVLTVSMMFLAQSESFASSNYRLMTQSRYGAEAGVQKAADYILNTDFSGPLGGLIPTFQSPVQFGGKDVVLSSDPDHPSNFPDAATLAAFQAATNGTIAAGNSTISYTAYATLLSLDSIQDWYTGVTKLVQTWQITSTASIAGIRKSTVEVTAMLDSDKVPTIAYAAFSTDPSCGSLNFWGNVSTNSYKPYDTSGNPTPTLTMQNTGGDVGTNGNLTIQGSVDVKGNLESPITGVGSCTNNGGVASVAETTSGNATVEGGAPLQLPQTLQLPAPPIPNPISAIGPVTINSPNGATCGALGLTAANCSVNGNVITLYGSGATPCPPLPYINLQGQAQLVLTASANTAANSYTLNGLSLASTNNLVQIESPSSSYGVKINLSGLNPDGTQMMTPVLDFSGGSSVGGFTTTPYNPADTCTGCSQFDSSLMQFLYGGNGTANIGGNPAASSVYYMPNATVNFSGNSSLFGAIIAHDLSINGGGNSISINYDQHLSGKGMTASAPMLASFSWKKY
jgi:hypothetical protein